MSKDQPRPLALWADAHQYHAEPQPSNRPTVTLLNATPDPLGSMAALTAMYEGRVVRSLSEVTDEERRAAFEAMMSTELSGALEVAQFHFLIEGVDRSFTHQLVRGRHAFYAQESLRFAVPEDWAATVPLPPSLAGKGEDDVLVRVWRKALNTSEDMYATLVHHGVPAEEARGLLPHAILTRVHWVVSLRELLHVAGLRTCTQAQFIWRLVMAELAKELRGWGTVDEDYAIGADAWQFELIANAIRPVCYHQGRCGFMAVFDRSCSIRNRVEANSEVRRKPAEWATPYDVVDGNPIVSGVGPQSVVRAEDGRPVFIGAIRDWEWAADPAAARRVGNA